MKRPLHESANAVLYRALDLPAGDRQQFIAQATAGDHALFDDVRTLLSRIEQLDQFLEDPLELPVEQKALPPPPPRHGDLIGEWKVEHELGRNGSDLILLVARTHSADSFATMRLAHSAARDGQTVARFERLRTRLAALHHRAIAVPSAVAVSADGRPYFVVARAAGVPIDQFCIQQNLSLAGRAALLATVCDAVHYMHQHLIVHRDLKPDYLLVGATGAVSVLDVGMVGEGWAVDPAYASPDQLSGEPLSVSADIYALGAVLYRLVTGCSAHAIDAGVQQRAGAGPVPAPSTRAAGSEVADTADTASTANTADPAAPALTAQLRRWIDPIVARALAVDPALRYPSAHALARDLELASAGLLAAVDAGSVAVATAKSADAADAADALDAAEPAETPAPPNPSSGPQQAGPQMAGPQMAAPPQPAPRRLPLAVAMLLAGFVGGWAGGPWLQQQAFTQELIKNGRLFMAPTPARSTAVPAGGQTASNHNAVAAAALLAPVTPVTPARPADFATTLALAARLQARADLDGAREAATEALALSATVAQAERDQAAGDANARLGAILAELGQSQEGLAALRRALALHEAHALMDKGDANGGDGGRAQAARAAADVQQAIARVLVAGVAGGAAGAAGAAGVAGAGGAGGDAAGAEAALAAARTVYEAQVKAAPNDAALHERLLSIEMALALAQNAQKHGRDTVATLAGLRRLTGAGGDANIDLLEAFVQPRGTAEKAYAAAQQALARLRKSYEEGAAADQSADLEPARAMARAVAMAGEIGVRARQKGAACANFDEAGKIYDGFGSRRQNAYDRLALERLAQLRKACS